LRRTCKSNLNVGNYVIINAGNQHNGVLNTDGATGAFSMFLSQGIDVDL